MLTAEHLAMFSCLYEKYRDDMMGKFYEFPERSYQRSRHILEWLLVPPADSPDRWVHWDLCSAVPFLAYCSAEQGHDTVAIDQSEVFAEGAAVLGVPFMRWYMTPRIPLPPQLAERKADLITMFGGTMPWSVLEYHTMAHRCCDYLNPGGRLVVRPNNGELWDKLRDTAVWQDAGFACRPLDDGSAVLLHRESDHD